MHKTDIEIAQQAEILPIQQMAERLHLTDDEWLPIGRTKAKLELDILNNRPRRGKMVLVTAINPTPAGEGKTTTSIGLADALTRLGKQAVLALREPSLGPVFGVKGGAAGGGYAQVIPMEELNLHFTGDLHAVTTANNLLAAILDNHLQQGNALGLDPRKIVWKRCVDLNDRALRNLVVGLGGPMQGVPREDGFDITAASEIMAVLCLASDLSDLKARIKRLVVGTSYDGKMITCEDLKAAGALTAVLKDAIKPNLVQTLEHTPAIIHGGPFANIAHGCNSVIATRMALALGDIVVTEAGFGADLGAQKFMDIKCRQAKILPDCCVVVATIRALKHHGGALKAQLNNENTDALAGGFPNLLKHVDNMRRHYKLPVVVAVNRFATDTPAEVELLMRLCEENGVVASLCDVWEKGGRGGEDLAQKVLAAVELNTTPGSLLYPDEMPLTEKIVTVVKAIYGGDKVDILLPAKRELARLQESGFGHLPICVAKTQYSLSDDPKKLSCPTGFTVTVRNAKLSAGAGFVVVYTGEIMTMPGLPKNPAAELIDIDGAGQISGLF